MEFISNLFKSKGKQVSSTLEAAKYKGWTKEQLVKKLLELEDNENTSNKLEKQLKKRKSNDLSSLKSSKKQKRQKEFDFSKYHTRFIALKFAYLGWNYNGLAIQKDYTPLPTVEGTILEAMNKCKLVPSMSPQDYNFSRCGRTDKGVSAMSQVISLNVRSNLSNEEQLNPLKDSDEIHYVDILNQVLPADIRISAVCLRPPSGFNARFSCYKSSLQVFIRKKNLDIEKMKIAAKLYQGEHDFRNFCKLDGSKQITNYNRTIISADILPINGDFYCFDLVGSAFLWHQVRCMMAILFLIGQGLEEPSLINLMLDIEKTPRKPIYDMASDVPLILYDCKFPEMNWSQPNLEDYKAIKYGKAISSLVLKYSTKATIAQIFEDVLPTTTQEFPNKTRINLGDGKGKIVGNYQKVSDRPVMESVETVNKNFETKKGWRNNN
ncbi:hypothetical protein TBLA_0C00580 [Henningerozyma blattae CBS 6284]|uniref:Pseudouridine synthase I TruA alpha/beta domain-containing protein n=1 Tax=Henningerozyma blattae (strain ATCC 34711 / CBS 6284 / DSM 70876 / NBRC 10599 / NRRL Y-10934 / UCD 77-7) TaxID=1071380 RepID=I2H0H2_HENB6|nr:hypothetical protein TBLA_0C00580 [Tetrapisispora blattae CBS 6284]CCH59874.1 hypothetical protein TBLA_0C00580 [Tetrapisispora blattae CBS 6284]